MIRIGTSGYSFKDWVGTIYPANTKESDMLSFYEKELGFDAVEVNFTYYRLPPPRTIAAMTVKTSDGFEFVVRSHQDMTHNIWTDDTRRTIKDNSYVFKAFSDGLAPMQEAEKLGCILIQFPSFFFPNNQNREYILLCKERLSGYPLVVEFRNISWVKDDKTTKQTLDFLERNELGFCVVDEPKLPRLMPLMPATTGQVGYLRLHGRNTNWFNASREERYNYLYSPDELQEFVPVVQMFSRSKPKSYIFFNNCHFGSAAKNAKSFKEMLNLAL